MVVNVTRGVRFSIPLLVGVEKRQLFEHPQQLPISVTAVETNGYPTPGSIRFSCDLTGNCTLKGQIDDDVPVLCAVYASDQYRLNNTLVKTEGGPTPAAAAKPDSPPLPELDNLVRRLDEALGHDGQLL